MMTRAVVGGVLVVWLASALMVWSLVPQLVANDPSLVGSTADVFGGEELRVHERIRASRYRRRGSAFAG